MEKKAKYITVEVTKNRPIQFPVEMVKDLKSKEDFKKMFPNLDADICWAAIKKGK